MAPMIFFSYFQDIFLNDFIKKPQTRNAREFLPLNISAVGSVYVYVGYVLWAKSMTTILVYVGLNNSHAKVENHVKTGCHNIWFMHH